MNIQTAWIKPPTQIRGLDHLGVQAPCIHIYGQLLPGITNVTDRARYYSFYPWLVWTLEKRGHQYDETFVDLLRRGDCLFTLIAERHAQTEGGQHDDHAAAMIGSRNLYTYTQALLDGEPIRLSEHTDRGEGKQYFQNKLGGLGQYYLGSFKELQMMQRQEGGGISYWEETSGALAKAMDQCVPGDLFMKTLEEDSVSPARLEELARFCPCHLVTSRQEHDLLCDLFFAQGPLFGEEDALPRRHTLQLLLHLAQALGQQNQPLHIDPFRGCMYSGTLPDRSDWTIPTRLQTPRTRWATYQRNELLSIAVQGLFYALMTAYDQADEVRCEDSAALCQWFVQLDEIGQVERDLACQGSFGQWVKATDDWLPHLEDWQHPYHEISLSEALVADTHTREEVPRKAIIEHALRLLLALANRKQGQHAYQGLDLEADYLRHYPINLSAFFKHTQSSWADLSFRNWVQWLVFHWGVEAHVRVALRKLRAQSQLTFCIKPTDYGMEVVRIFPVAHTAPRFAQAFRILRDLGLLQADGDGWTLTAAGAQWMEVDNA